MNYLKKREKGSIASFKNVHFRIIEMRISMNIHNSVYGTKVLCPEEKICSDKENGIIHIY
jgi:hypothetical protein